MLTGIPAIQLDIYEEMRADQIRFNVIGLGLSSLVAVLVFRGIGPAVMAGFGGVISEVGASIMVGGNIKGYTRVLTTATVMETGMGNFDIAIALGIILLLLTFAVNYILTLVQQHDRPR